MLFLTKTELLLEKIMGKIFKMCLILKGAGLSSTEMSNVDILIKSQVGLML